MGEIFNHLIYCVQICHFGHLLQNRLNIVTDFLDLYKPLDSNIFLVKQNSFFLLFRYPLSWHESAICGRWMDADMDYIKQPFFLQYFFETILICPNCFRLESGCVFVANLVGEIISRTLNIEHTHTHEVT